MKLEKLAVIETVFSTIVVSRNVRGTEISVRPISAPHSEVRRPALSSLYASLETFLITSKKFIFMQNRYSGESFR